ncbi:esterase FE4-like isoform X2 [Planococcus citri]|uniref:esterase FE4-like isoform X2 n=1 Tax=Planococcus citri TaxID=170843 RepID=UPI0031F913D5
MILTIKQGEIQGNQEYAAWTKKKYFSFLGIPYAEPPIGDLRFKPPVEAKNWHGVFKANKEGGQCYQTTFEKTAVYGTEDCLYLNVFIPEWPDNETKRAVMLNVHGGGFCSFSGSPLTSSADHLMNYDVILVTFNYRLHVLGFLNLGLPECAGNMGLKDQLIAFRWVKENIEYFGGDPNNITLFGQSAGASSIHLHMMSPLSHDLFHKCILQSGSALSSWSFSDSPEERAFELGRILGFHGNDKRELLEFLKSTPVRDLSMANESLRNELKKRYPGKSTSYPFLPSIEIPSEAAILTDHPEKLLKNTRKIPVIVGMNDKEGGNMFMKEPKLVEILNSQFGDVIRLNYETMEITEEGIADLKNYYFPNGITPIRDKNSITDVPFTPTIIFIYSARIYFSKTLRLILQKTMSGSPIVYVRCGRILPKLVIPIPTWYL